MFVVEVTALAVTVILLPRFLSRPRPLAAFEFQIALWLWFTVLFANFAEAMAEGRGKAQADNLRKTRTETQAKLVTAGRQRSSWSPATELERGDVVLVEAGDIIPGDGEVIEGVAAVNEAAITGESAPVIRESGGDRSAVTGGTTVISDWHQGAHHRQPGRDFPRPHDRAGRGRAAPEDAQRNRAQHPARRPDDHFHAGVRDASTHSRVYSAAPSLSLPVLVALLVCLIPTTIGGLLSAIGIAGMDRMIQHNVLAMSGRAVEAAGDVDTLLLDKTGTITLGNRQATEFIPVARRARRGCWPTRRNWRRSPTRRPRAARSWCWPSASTTCAAANWRRRTRNSSRSPRRPG